MEKKVFNVPNVPADLLERAHEIARSQDRPLAQVVRELLREFVVENEPKLPAPVK